MFSSRYVDDAPKRRPRIYGGPNMPLSPDWYADLTPAQRLVALYAHLAAPPVIGSYFKPVEFARRVGATRGTIYRHLRMLSQMGVPVVQVSHGSWTLQPFLPEDFNG